MPRTHDVVVVGAGIIGLAIAREAAKSGLRVLVLEKGVPGREASTAAAGILSAQLEADRRHALLPLLLESQRLYRSFVHTLQSESGIDCGLRLRGAIDVARTPEAFTRLGRRLAFQRSLGLAVERLSGRELRRLEPGIAAGCPGGLLYPRDGSVDNSLLVRALVRAARRTGARILPRTAVTRLLVGQGGGVVGVAAGAVRYPAGAVVIAAGAWSGSIRGAGLEGPPTHPVRGQILCLSTDSGAPRRVLHTQEAYLVPRAGGRVLVGSTMERVGFRRGVTAGALAALGRAAVALVPALRGARVLAAWAGFRPATVDGLPAIGPAAPGLHYATGHLRNGILLAPATARVIARLLVGRDPEIDLAPFSPRRFSA